MNWSDNADRAINNDNSPDEDPDKILTISR